MSRRRQAVKRPLMEDSKFHSTLVSRLVCTVMTRGKKSVAQRIVYGAFDQIADKNPNSNPLEILQRAVDNVKPRLEVKARRVGGATYQVPLEVPGDRQLSLAMRWLVDFADARKGIPMREALAAEIMEAYQGQGNAIRKRDEVHKMAQANKAFAHFRWERGQPFGTRPVGRSIAGRFYSLTLDASSNGQTEISEFAEPRVHS